ncbi:tyrosine recombinase [Nitrolancea hollandica]|uniref:Tyrosine recombinase XerC n=1 Tax=Nitrolancea hollandica Lb TaxID=1129897 RepID=I4EMH0_9BACT|nr:tyrosine recombinase [Nitrolancea hollandica]CCF85883.1 Tyrosine recombinase xerC [Nitrolancea hollandica Lb]
MEDQIERFLAALAQDRGFSGNTIAAYRNDLGQFAVFLRTDKKIESWKEFTDNHLISYVLHLRDRSYASSTVARKIAAVKSFCHYIVDQGVLRHDPSTSLTSPRVEKFVPRTLSPDQIAALLEQPARSRTPEALRDKAMLETLYATGMRVSELTSLDLEDIDFTSQRVQCGKKPDRCRWVPLASEAGEALDEYLQIGRPLLRQSSDDPAVFLNHRGTRLTRQGFWLILKAYGEAVNIEDITPHTIRHSFAAHALHRGHNLQDVQKILGHMNISTTQIYQQVAAQFSNHRSNGHALAESMVACYDKNGSD